MSENAKFRFSIPVIATALLICTVSVIQLANSAPGTQIKDAKLKTSSGEMKIESSGASKIATTIKRATDANSSKDTVNISRKFQARMGSDQQQQLSQQQSSQAPVQQDPYYIGSDSWHPHNLLPTFTDQEQGDEMVALASGSDSEQPEHYNKVPANATRPGEKYMDHGRFSSSQTPSISLSNGKSVDKAGANSGRGAAMHSAIGDKQHRQQDAEEYYSDDDLEDDEEVRDSIKALRGEFESGMGNQDRKARDSKALRELQRTVDGAQYTDDDFNSSPQHHLDAAFNQGYYQNGSPVDPTMNDSSKQPSSNIAQDTRWLPNSGTQPGQLNLNLNQPMAQISQQQFSSEQLRQHDATPASGDKQIGNFFGGRDATNAFSKTDAAIEYLRNLLKTKQQNSHNSTALSDSSPNEKQQQVPDQSSTSAFTKGSNSNRLSSFASKLSQMLNSTASVFSGVSSSNSSASKFDYSPMQLPVTRPQGGISSMIPLQPSAGEGKFLPRGSQQSMAVDGAKFSAVDAKPISSPPSTDGFDQSFPQTQGSPPSTTKPIYDNLARQQQQQTNPVDSPTMFASTHAEPSKPEPYSQDPSSANTPNGTPLGGDYIESLDDYPRGGLREHQPQQLQQLFPSESRPTPVVQQNSKLDQHSSSPAHLIESTTGISNKNQIIQKQQQEGPVQVDPMHLDRESYEAFQRQLSGVPSSSKYFHMQRPSSEHHTQRQQQGGKQLAPYIEVAPAANNNPVSVQAKPEQAQPIFRPRPTPHQHKQQQHQHHRNIPAIQTTYEQNPSNESKLIQQFPERSKPQQSRLQQQLHAPISSKIHTNEQAFSTSYNPSPANRPRHHQQAYLSPLKQLAPQVAVNQPAAEQTPQMARPEAALKQKPPKIISYNYFESPSETGESELMTTNYQLGDTLYSSTGGVEQILSNGELEAIQNQFLTAEHPIVPVAGGDQISESGKSHQARQAFNQDQSLTGLLANLKNNYQSDMLQKLNSPAKQAEDAMKELASNDDQVVGVAASPQLFNQPAHTNNGQRASNDLKRPQESKSANFADAKKKSLIVYLNHPRPVDMSKVTSPDEGYSLSQSIDDAQSEPFISAKEFDIHGLSKDTKHLDISNMRELGDLSKEGHDKDGLSVVVIGDAYKYKKIVLLISSKSGGLKFIPMVKDMKK